MLAANSPLRELHLYGNVIGDAGCVALANALVFNRGLRVLYLHGNRIGDVGATVRQTERRRGEGSEICCASVNVMCGL